MYSQACVVKGFCYTAGCIGLRPGQDSISFDPNVAVAEQTRIALENLKAVLEEAGCALSDVVKVTVFVTDINDGAAMNGVYKDYFISDDFKAPARSMVAVAKLPLGAKVELEAVAALP